MVRIEGSLQEKEAKRKVLQERYNQMDLMLVRDILAFVEKHPGEDVKVSRDNSDIDYHWAMLMCIDYGYIEGFANATIMASFEPTYNHCGFIRLTESGADYLRKLQDL